MTVLSLSVLGFRDPSMTLEEATALKSAAVFCYFADNLHFSSVKGKCGIFN